MKPSLSTFLRRLHTREVQRQARMQQLAEAIRALRGKK